MAILKVVEEIKSLFYKPMTAEQARDLLEKETKRKEREYLKLARNTVDPCIKHILKDIEYDIKTYNSDYCYVNLSKFICPLRKEHQESVSVQVRAKLGCLGYKTEPLEWEDNSCYMKVSY